MGQITSNIGLVSGINTAEIIDQLIALETQPRIRVEEQNSTLQEQQSAFAGISAQLLSLKLNAGRLTTDATYTATNSSSSNEAVATVTSAAGAVPGDYRFSVRRLVSAQQSITSGFRDRDSSFVAPDGGLLTFNRGEARLDRETRLDELNGGAGVQRGKIKITDLSGSSATVDLSDAITLRDVVDRINDVGIGVRADITGGGLTITDITGRSGGDADTSLIVADIGRTTTATDLGIAANTDATSITGAPLYTLGRDSVLANLNDGLGVRTEGGNDFQVTTRDGSTYNIDASNAVTLGDLFDTIEEVTEGKVSGGVRTDGLGLELIDTSGGGGAFTVAAVGTSGAAEDLGLLTAAAGATLTGERVIGDLDTKLLKFTNGGNGLAAFGGPAYNPANGTTAVADLFGGAGLTLSGTADADLRITARDDADGTSVFDIDLDGLATIDDLVAAVDTATGGKVTLELRDDRLFALDNTGGENRLVIESLNGAAVAEELGLSADRATDVVAGAKLDPTGTGDADTRIRLTTADGTTTDIDLATAETAGDLIELINTSGAGVTASLNGAGTGLRLVDDTTGTTDFTVESLGDGVLAEQLGLAGTFTDGVSAGRDLEFAFVNDGASLDKLGIGAGRFTIRDSDGKIATVDLTNGDESTIGDVISEINSRGLAINARVNDAGDGIVIEDTGSGAVDLEITDEEGSSASDLGIAGTFASGLDIDGSFKRYVRVQDTDTLDSLTDKVNNAELGIRASVISDGSVGRPFRLSFSGRTSGAGGAFSVGDGGLGFNTTEVARAQDAVVFIGGENPETAIAVTSPTNTLAGVIPGATVTLNSTSDDPVSITVSDNPDALVEEVNSFVSGFNDLITRIDELDSYDVETETRGLLLGDPVLQQVRSSMFNAVIGFNNDLPGRYKSLSQVGITVGSGGTSIELDEAKLRAALETDADAVQDLFALEQFEIDPDTNEETETVAAQGIAVEIDKLLERLTDADTGVLQNTIDRLDQQILANNDRIDRLNDSIEDKRERLQRDFNNMEAALARIQDQGAALSQLSQVAASSSASIG